MYRKILITTDGSAISSKTACAGVAFAAQLGAEVLAVFVAPEYQYPIYVEIIPPSYPSEEEYRAAMRRAGQEHVKAIQESAARQGLRFEALTAFAESTAQKIVEVAAEQHCDLIIVGSHGRHGLALLLGSTANDVLHGAPCDVLAVSLKKPSA